MKAIHIGKVSVPLVDYAVGAAAVLGIRDSGKTVTSKGIAEQLLDNDVPIIVFDAVGKWRWLKVAAERDHGKAYKVVVAGGREPDLPLTPHSVPEIVRAALKERIPLVIDLFSKELSKGDWRRIVQTAIKIIHYENEGGAVHVFLEEAAEFVPQRIMDRDVALVYGEVEKLVRMGGNASVGITLINQRSQEVNKAVLEQCTSLVLGCQVGNKAIEAVGKWVDRLDKGIAAEVIESLPKLAAGEAWVWTRQSPDKPSREKMPMCRSFHPDRRTPELVLATVKRTDTAAFVAKLADSIPKVIEEAKANDPAELNRTIADLKRKLTQAEQRQPEPATAPKPVEVPVLVDTELHHIKAALNGFTAITEILREVAPIISRIEKGITHFTELTGKNKNHWTLPTAQVAVQRPPLPKITKEWVQKRAHLETGQEISAGRPESNGELTRPQIQILSISDMLRARGLTPSKEMIARWHIKSDRSGIHPNTGSYGQNLARLRELGYLDGCALTEAGRAHAELLPGGLVGIEQAVTGPQWKIVTILHEQGPQSKQSLAEALGLHPNTGSYGQNLARLRTMGLIPERGEIKLTPAAYQ